MGRDGDTPKSGLSDDSPPAGLGLFEGLGEEGSKKKVLELGVLSVGGGNVRKEDRLDDTATSPHSSDTGVVQVPVVNLGSLTHEHEALGVRDNLGGVESLLKVANGLLITLSVACCNKDLLNELLLVTLEGLLGGPGMTLEALTRSSLMAERHRAKTASPIRVTGIPLSRASMAVHLPVPFWPALSRIFRTMGTPSVSLNLRMSRVISMRKESRTPLFHCRTC